MSIHKWAWGIALVCLGLSMLPQFDLPLISLIEAVAFVIAGIAYIAGI